MEKDWLLREFERTKRRVDAMPNGQAQVEYARIWAEDLNRAEAEEYRLQRELQERLGGK